MSMLLIAAIIMLPSVAMPHVPLDPGESIAIPEGAVAPIAVPLSTPLPIPLPPPSNAMKIEEAEVEEVLVPVSPVSSLSIERDDKRAEDNDFELPSSPLPAPVAMETEEKNADEVSPSMHPFFVPVPFIPFQRSDPSLSHLRDPRSAAKKVANAMDLIANKINYLDPKYEGNQIKSLEKNWLLLDTYRDRLNKEINSGKRGIKHYFTQ